ncbi:MULTISPECIES: hypothetical protein [unclassified Paenibacillus]|uniref:hypothetical protein n=1 Tax=unclassified Paenibacillus TaxID=185978 RepID=UPI0003E216FB|nr:MULTISPECIES: hypothetical protein [unclassified Paenibacillus]ETT34189.1 hypothetical protein C162_29890 [Paenibacillus sp. FSL R7-269]OMF96504.1 hypothetical protein BK147_14150 [Paenibacillus sp. FSL R7-0337]
MTFKPFRIPTILLILSVTLLSGCEGEPSNNLAAADNEEYNLTITNNSPLFLKSVVVTVDEKDDIHINSQIDSNIKFGEVAKFRIKNGNHSLKITLNPKKNYSVSKEVSEKFEQGKVINYQVEIDRNEVTINK